MNTRGLMELIVLNIGLRNRRHLADALRHDGDHGPRNDNRHNARTPFPDHREAQAGLTQFTKFHGRMGHRRRIGLSAMAATPLRSHTDSDDEIV